jgi:hypothetical protein
MSIKTSGLKQFDYNPKKYQDFLGNSAFVGICSGYSRG